MLKRAELKATANRTTKENMVHSVRRRMRMCGAWVKKQVEK
jgi:hypothetical protein